MRLLLTVQYLGTRYAGWQSQTNALAIQDVVEAALGKLCGRPVAVTAAGRTDAGVHAEDQKIHLDLPIAIPLPGLLRGLNDLLPPDIGVPAGCAVPEEFHARFSAVSKTYRYQIWNREIADVFLAPTHAHVRLPLDGDRMAEAAAFLVGQHDFRAYTVLHSEAGTTVRTLEHAVVERKGDAIRIEVTADGFLRFMVRRIAGQLIEIGRGKIPIEATKEALEPTFAEARWTAPPEGLVLAKVRYGAASEVPLLLC